MEHLHGRGYSREEFLRRLRNSKKDKLILNYKKALKELTSFNNDADSYQRLGLDLSVTDTDTTVKISGYVTPIDKFTRMSSLYYSLEIDMGDCILTESVSNGNDSITDKIAEFKKDFYLDAFNLYILHRDVDASKESFLLGSLTAYLLKLLTIEAAKLEGEKSLTEFSARFLNKSFIENKYNLLTPFDISKFDSWESIVCEPELEFNLYTNTLTIDLLIMPIKIDNELPFILRVNFDFNAKRFDYTFEKITTIEPDIETINIDEFSCSFNLESDFSKYGLTNLGNEASKNNLESLTILNKVLEFISSSFWL